MITDLLARRPWEVSNLVLRPRRLVFRCRVKLVKNPRNVGVSSIIKLIHTLYLHLKTKLKVLSFAVLYHTLSILTIRTKSERKKIKKLGNKVASDEKIVTLQ